MNTEAVDLDAEELPLLTYEVARDITEFPPFTVVYGPEEIREYVEATGDDRPEYVKLVPPGMAAIFGRQGYLRLHRMPPGGVLLGQDMQWLEPAEAGVEMTIQSRIDSMTEDPKGRRRIVFVTTATQHGRPVAQVRINAGWPS